MIARPWTDDLPKCRNTCVASYFSRLGGSSNSNNDDYLCFYCQTEDNSWVFCLLWNLIDLLCISSTLKYYKSDLNDQNSAHNCCFNSESMICLADVCMVFLSPIMGWKQQGLSCSGWQLRYSFHPPLPIILMKK